jgi:hypothetical protein
MHLADLAWCDVDTTTIKNCWQKSGILPEEGFSSSHIIQPLIPISSLLQDSSLQVNPAAHAERQVEAALDDLVSTGALQQMNQMDIESLLNPKGEFPVLMETFDREIY